MHPYAIDSDERKIINFYLAIISIIIVYLVGVIIGFFAITMPWYISPPSIFGIFLIFWVIFDRYLWKYSLFFKIGLVKSPDISGSWNGYLQSSFDSHQEKHEIHVTIFQTWTNISIILKTEKSRSKSEVAGIAVNNPDGVVISYLYLNEPKVDAVSSMVIHRGTAVLRYSVEKASLSGEYYTGRARENYGSIELYK